MPKFFIKSWVILFLVIFFVLLFAGFFNIKDFIAGISQAGIIEEPFDTAQGKPVFDDLPPPDLPAQAEENAVVLTAELTAEEKQNLIDDIKEKIDAIQQQIFLLQDKQNPDLDNLEEDKEKEEENKDDENKNKNQDESKTAVIYPKILISEVQVSPIEQRFVKLYNPNDFAVDLTGWYLQRKTQNADSWSSLVSSTNFENKTISASSYFLIARELFYADILLPDLTLSENNSLVLKNPNGEVSDTALTSVAAPAVSGGGGSAPIVYPKILILEIQVAGQTDEKQEFVELYNPNGFVVDLTGWYLQRKTSGGKSWSSYAPSRLFLDKSIGSNDYFVISREGYYEGSNDIFTTYSITNDNSFILKNPKGDISDKLGFGQAKDFETAPFLTNPEDGQSIGRVFNEESQTYKDTDDNSVDFKLSMPTPGKENKLLTED